MRFPVNKANLALLMIQYRNLYLTIKKVALSPKYGTNLTSKRLNNFEVFWIIYIKRYDT